MKKLSILIAALTFGLGAMATHTFFYDTYDTDDTSIKIVVDSYVLNTCTDYTITVDGTYSIWTASTWTTNCGTVEAMPEIPSPGTTNGQVGFDMEYIFGLNNPSHPLCGSLPFHTTRIEFSTDGGSTWFHPTPIVGAYNPTHVYQYTITGGGFPLQVQHMSTLNSDDYGQLQFDIDENLVDPCEFTPEFAWMQEGCAIQFTDISTLPCAAGFSILGVTYDFGDGTTSNVFNPTHAYTATGLYTVQYTVWVTNGESCCKLTFSESIFAEACDPCTELIPNVNFTSSGSFPTINFTETGIAGLNPGGLAIGYSWSFGDGSFGNGADISHTYAAAGTYRVCLTAFYYDEDTHECCSETVCQDITIGDRSPISDLGGYKVKAKNHSPLKVFPNPSDGVFTIATKDDYISGLRVFDQTGKVVYAANGSENKNLDIDITHLNAGYYILVAEGLSGKQYTSKIMLK